MSKLNLNNVAGILFSPLWILTFIFVIAKITGHLTWTWWWVFSPIWISFAALFTIVGICMVVLIIWEIIRWIQEKKNGRQNNA